MKSDLPALLPSSAATLGPPTFHPPILDFSPSSASCMPHQSLYEIVAAKAVFL